jgi:hypothetical protein
MSDRVKLTLASLTVLMLPFGLGFSLSVLIIAAIMATGLDLAKERFGEMQLSDNFYLRPFLFRTVGRLLLTSCTSQTDAIEICRTLRVIGQLLESAKVRVSSWRTSPEVFRMECSIFACTKGTNDHAMGTSRSNRG